MTITLHDLKDYDVVLKRVTAKVKDLAAEPMHYKIEIHIHVYGFHWMMRNTLLFSKTCPMEYTIFSAVKNENFIGKI